MRVFSGVVFGYLLFELLWRAIFQVTDTDPHAPANQTAGNPGGDEVRTA